MNELGSLGVILLLALLAGHLVKFLRIPEVTGYILAGIALGPSGVGWVSHDNLVALEVFSQVALGLILFSLGAVFERERFGRLGRRAATITACESLLVATLVTGGMLLTGQPWPAALLLGAVAIETAAASTLMVLRETNAEGPLSETLTGVFALNNILCLMAFSLAATAVDWSRMSGGLSVSAVYAAVFPLVWQILGGVALGYLVGLLLASWSRQVVEHGERLILLVGCVLLCVGTAATLEISPLVASLAVGATVVNLSADSRRLFSALSQTDPPLYAIFFVIAGADLNVALLGSLGVAGAVYLAGRSVGKLAGGYMGARLAGELPGVRNPLGFGLLSQAGLAVGLSLAIDRRFPDLADTVVTVILASVVVFEMVGPLSARFAIQWAGEARAEMAERPEEAVVLD